MARIDMLALSCGVDAGTSLVGGGNGIPDECDTACMGARDADADGCLRRMTRSTRLLSSLVILSLACLIGSGAAQAQNCPCWTAEELAGIRIQDCRICKNEIQFGAPGPDLTCTSINGDVGEGCTAGVPGNGWVEVWDGGQLSGVDPPGCLMWDPAQGIDPGRILNLTEQEARACADEIAAYGASLAATIPFPGADVLGTPTFGCYGMCFPPECELFQVPGRVCSNSTNRKRCDTNDDCLGDTCNLDDRPCLSDADCPPVGNCTVTDEFCESDVECPGLCTAGGTCETNADCPGALNQCQFIQTCDGITAQNCPFPMGICVPPSVGFTFQDFSLVSGLRSELLTNADFSASACEGVLSSPGLTLFYTDPSSPPPPGDARYLLTRADEGVSCRSFGDSSVDPNPRDALDAICP